MVTNNHVLATDQQAASEIAEFNFEKDLNGLDVARTELRFDPGAGFHTSSLAQGCANAAFDAILLADVPVAKDEYVNIIQHAGGGPKMIALSPARPLLGKLSLLSKDSLATIVRSVIGRDR